MNSSFYTLTHHLTMYQLLCLFLCTLFISPQIKAWGKKQNTNRAFIRAYHIRFYMMLICFAAASPVIIFSVSMISIFLVISMSKNYYASIPEEYQTQWFEGKEKPLGIEIGWTQTQQALYWFVADMILFYLLIVFFPWVLSSELLIPFDTIIGNRFGIPV